MSIQSLRRPVAYRPGSVVPSRIPSRTVSSAVWLAMRGTGLLLSVLVLGHLLFVHLLTDVSQTGSTFVARRWSSALWVTWDGAMLTAAFLHAGIGMRTVIRDYVRGSRARTAWQASMYIAIAAFCGLGWYAIVSVVASTSR